MQIIPPSDKGITISSRVLAVVGVSFPTGKNSYWCTMPLNYITSWLCSWPILTFIHQEHYSAKDRLYITELVAQHCLKIECLLSHTFTSISSSHCRSLAVQLIIILNGCYCTAKPTKLKSMPKSQVSNYLYVYTFWRQVNIGQLMPETASSNLLITLVTFRQWDLEHLYLWYNNL